MTDYLKVGGASPRGQGPRRVPRRHAVRALPRARRVRRRRARPRRAFDRLARSLTVGPMPASPREPVRDREREGAQGRGGAGVRDVPDKLGRHVTAVLATRPTTVWGFFSVCRRSPVEGRRRRVQDQGRDFGAPRVRDRTGPLLPHASLPGRRAERETLDSRQRVTRQWQKKMLGTGCLPTGGPGVRARRRRPWRPPPRSRQRPGTPSRPGWPDASEVGLITPTRIEPSAGSSPPMVLPRASSFFFRTLIFYIQ